MLFISRWFGPLSGIPEDHVTGSAHTTLAPFWGERLGKTSMIARLPAETKLYCAHEYTKANAAFALTVDPQNADLKKRSAEVDALRAENLPTVPTTVALERATNPFLRAADPSLQTAINMAGDKPVEVFAETRRLKDSF